ncbi:cartilage matrix protein [Patella vulgata]|uniref:cartilage matrix protein n=1 Tax=Patella vulgata TaxID=6465 RepID=UPI0024A86879|nr:cartilage matrix protein [Patella vulgata]
MMNYLFTLVGLFTVVFAAPSKLERTCGGKPADVVFVIDSSSSIWPEDFSRHVLPFVRDVTAMFDIGPGLTQSRVGVVTFGTNHYLRFHLNTFLDKETVLKRIMAIDMTGGETNTAGVLNYVTDHMFTSKRGSRIGVDHIVIVLTDGESKNMEKTRKAADHAHQSGLQVFSIGVGSGVDVEELGDIASDPKSKFMFEITDFRALQRIKEELAIRTCEIATTTTTTTTQAPTTTTTLPPTTTKDLYIADAPLSLRSCGGKPADVYFILDSSSSIWKKDYYEKMVKFVHDVSDIFDIGSDKTRVGVVTFSDQNTPVFGLNDFTSREELLAAMSSDVIPYLTGGTNTAAAIKYVAEIGFSPIIARPGVAHVAVIITDGQSKDAEATLREAEAAKKSGIYMFAIGVGDSVDQQELTDMASQPSKDYVFSVNNFGALDTIKNLLAVKTCLVSSSEEMPNDQQSNNVCELEPTDIAFGFDSFAMGQKQSHRVVEIITSLTNHMTSRSKGYYQFSVLSNACSRHKDVPMTDIRQAESVLGDMKEDMTSQLHQIIKQLRRNAYSPSNNARLGAQKVAILVLDDSAVIDKKRVIANAKRAKASGVEIFAVTLSSMDQSFVSEIVSDSVKTHLIQAERNENVLSIRNKIIKQLC